MRDRLTVETVLERASRTHASASRLARPSRLFAGRHEKQFARAIEEFMRSLRHLPESEVARVTADQEARLRELIDTIVEDVERFIALHQTDNLTRFERNQHLVTRVYDLRQAFEAIARRASPNLRVIDLRRQERLLNANQPKR